MFLYSRALLSSATIAVRPPPHNALMVVGASRGIGAAVVSNLLATLDKWTDPKLQVIATVRTPQVDPEGELMWRASRQPNFTRLRVECNVDLEQHASLAALFDRLDSENVVLHRLLINGGVMHVDNPCSEDLMHMQSVNTVGALTAASALMPLLARHSRLAFTSSRMASMSELLEMANRVPMPSIDQDQPGASIPAMPPHLDPLTHMGYGISKMALNMGAAVLSTRLRSVGIRVALLHPGRVRTALTKGEGTISAVEAAEGIVKNWALSPDDQCKALEFLDTKNNKQLPF